MHLLVADIVTLDEAATAVDLGQTPAEFVFLSFTDSDLSGVAAAWTARGVGFPELRLASLAQLKHPYSVDLYVEKVVSHARFVLVRLLGGMDYWRYGVEELAAAARSHGVKLAMIPGDHVEDPRLDQASTVPVADLRRLWNYFQDGGPDNLGNCLAFLRDGHAPDPVKIAPMQRYDAACHPALPGAQTSLLLFYRSVYLAQDTAPILALSAALAARGLGVVCVCVTSLKDPAAIALLAPLLRAEQPDIILNATAFSARADALQSGILHPGVLDEADAPVLQVVMASSTLPQWQVSSRGLGANDLAMNIVLPEFDGRILAGTISFKCETQRLPGLEFARTIHQPEAAHIAHVADYARAYAHLRAKPRHARRLACILSDYPGKGGRTGYAVGLDTAQSIAVIARHLREADYDIADLPQADAIIAQLDRGLPRAVLTLADYLALLAALPQSLQDAIAVRWGNPADDPAVHDGAFWFAMIEAGKLCIAIQPSRGERAPTRANQHDLSTPPCHGYVAFYLWLRHVLRIDAMIHCGTHGTLEWLPGKAMALGDACAPQALVGAIPVFYPFIVNNPGEAAQAKRRIGAVTIGHLTPPLMQAGHHGAALQIEALLDEYAQAQLIDTRRASFLADAILEQAEASGLLADANTTQSDKTGRLAALDAWLCDIKEMRIGDGLHVFGQAADVARTDAMAALSAGGSLLDPAAITKLLVASPDAEINGLLAGLDGRFVQPGPAGAPVQGRLDVLPTGRNLFTCDPRTIPSRTAWEIGKRTAQQVVMRYAQDHGDWPRHIVLDLWGSATMRTGGDDLAQAMALLGVRPRWDPASARVNGFEILPLAQLERARVDVTLRISGLFRDMFPTQIALFHAAITAVGALDEEDADNPLAASCKQAAEPRIFGAAPGHYGLGVGAMLQSGTWQTQAELGEAYVASSSFAYGGTAEPSQADAALRACIARADAYVHVQDMAGQDVLDADAFAQHEGGFAAAAAMLGASPALYHVDTTRQDQSRVRTVSEEITRVLRARATNPRWLNAQMRHGHRGAAEIAETVENLFAYAATTQAVPARHFELLFDATCGDEDVRAFLEGANPNAAAAIARCFEAALARGFWDCRRNSSRAVLAEMGQL